MSRPDVAERVARDRAEQGLPRHIDDPAVLDWLAAELLKPHLDQPAEPAPAGAGERRAS